MVVAETAEHCLVAEVDRRRVGRSLGGSSELEAAAAAAAAHVEDRFRATCLRLDIQWLLVLAVQGMRQLVVRRQLQ